MRKNTKTKMKQRKERRKEKKEGKKERKQEKKGRKEGGKKTENNQYWTATTSHSIQTEQSQDKT